MIVADTGAIIGLVDGDDRHHGVLSEIFEATQPWIVPAAVLPEVDYMLGTRVGERARRLFLGDVAGGAFPVEWGSDADLDRAVALENRHESLEIGLVDATVMVVAERLHASAIATLDIRHFGSVAIGYRPKLFPRDW